MNIRNNQQNLDNRRYNLNISSIHLNSMSNREKTTNDTNSSININSNADINGSLHENVQEGNFILAQHSNYNNVNIEGNEDESLNYFDISKININRTNENNYH